MEENKGLKTHQAITPEGILFQEKYEELKYQNDVQNNTIKAKDYIV